GIGHEQPPPGFAFAPTVLAVIVERVRPPGGMCPLAHLNALLIRLEPMHAPSLSRVVARKAGLPERVYDQPGSEAIGLRPECGLHRSRWVGAPGGLAPPPPAQRPQGPAPIVPLGPLHLADERVPLRLREQVLPPGRGQQ